MWGSAFLEDSYPIEKSQPEKETPVVIKQSFFSNTGEGWFVEMAFAQASIDAELEKK